MKKKKSNMTKEIVILIVLMILILLIMAVALYDFIPSNLEMPESITYTADSATTSVKQEIAYTNGGDSTADENNTDEEEMITSLKSYSIQASDLTVYGQKNLYNSGNSNPFDYAEETTPANTTEGDNSATNTGDTSNSGTTNGQSTSANTTNSNSSTGTFFESSSSK